MLVDADPYRFSGEKVKGHRMLILFIVLPIYILKTLSLIVTIFHTREWLEQQCKDLMILTSWVRIPLQGTGLSD
jgi:hypothetical protein